MIIVDFLLNFFMILMDYFFLLIEICIERKVNLIFLQIVGVFLTIGLIIVGIREVARLYGRKIPDRVIEIDDMIWNKVSIWRLIFLLQINLILTRVIMTNRQGPIIFFHHIRTIAFLDIHSVLFFLIC